MIGSKRAINRSNVYQFTMLPSCKSSPYTPSNQRGKELKKVNKGGRGITSSKEKPEMGSHKDLERRKILKGGCLIKMLWIACGSLGL